MTTETELRSAQEGASGDPVVRQGFFGIHGRKLILGAAGAGAGLVVLLLVFVAVAGIGRSDSNLVFFTVKRADLAIDVVERGNLESQNDEKVICEVDDIDGDGISGTTIVWVVRNGESVEEGQLLVELDGAQLRERLDRQILDTERATSIQIQAKVKYENQQTQNETLRAEAKLKVDLAELALKQFEDEDGGTFQLDLQDLELTIQEAHSSRLIEQKNLAGVEQLHKLGYRSRGELDQARLSALKAERGLATAISRKKELVEYQYRKTRMELEGAEKSTRRTLEQVKRDNEALLAQAKAAMDAADRSLMKEEERLARYREQVDKCKIYSPRAGMVAYASGQSRWRVDVRAGAPVRPKQTILTIPNLRKMQVKTSVHESVLDQIRAGLPVTVRVDAAPGRSYPGSVQSVALLPEQGGWMGADTKVYETVVTIDEEVDRIKPGMTAVVRIHVALLEDVLSVPVQAIVRIDRDDWCYVEAGRGTERRKVVLGGTNEKFVEIREGVRDGERVVLNPMAIFDEPERKATRDDERGRDADSPDREAPAEVPGGRLAEGERKRDPERRGSRPPGASERQPGERVADKPRRDPGSRGDKRSRPPRDRQGKRGRPARGGDAAIQ